MPALAGEHAGVISGPTATKPGPPTVTALIDWRPSPSKTSSSEGTRSQPTPAAMVVSGGVVVSVVSEAVVVDASAAGGSGPRTDYVIDRIQPSLGSPGAKVAAESRT